MSQSFRFKYDQLQENNPTNKQSPLTDDVYPGGSHVRNVCFVLPDGNRIFLNYGYLVSGEYFPEDGRIALSFTSHTVTLAGIHLEALFYEFMQHLPRQIVCADARYNSASDKKSPVINEIVVRGNE